MIQGTVHRVFNATSGWQSFDVALKKNRKIWTQNQYPTEWSSSIANKTFDKIVTIGKSYKIPPPHPKKKNNFSKQLKVLTQMSLNQCFVKYRGNFTQNFASRLKKLCDLQIIFTTRKLRTCLPNLKSSFDNNLKSHVELKVTCSGCSSIYVGQSSGHFTTRILEHQKTDSLVRQHVVEYCGTELNIEWEILDVCRRVEKLMTIEAIYIKKLEPQTIVRNEYQERKLTLKYQFN